MAMAMAKAWFVFALAVALFSLQLAMAEQEEEEEAQGVSSLISLSDKNFEHDTQAATGQTTGSWLILFTPPDCRQCKDIEESLVKVVSPSKGSPILAKVNVSNNPRTSKRFNVSETPKLKLFRNMKMFSYKGDWSSSDLLDFAMVQLDLSKLS